MKRKLYPTAVLLLFSITLCGQGRLEISLMPGYAFSSRINFTQGSGQIKDGLQWFGAVETPVAHNLNFGLVYSHMSTDASVYGYDYEATGGIAFDYIMAALVKYIAVGENGKMRPYAGFDLGCAIITPAEENYSTAVRPAVGLKLGMQYMISEMVGLKLQTQFLSPIHSSGASFYYGYGGSGTSVSSYVGVYQFGFSGGVVFAFGKSRQTGGAGGHSAGEQ
jgi:hypothetical protein